jgi:cell division transport system permease protein
MRQLLQPLVILLKMVGRGLVGAVRAPLVQLVAVTTIALCLTLVGAVALVATNLGQLGRGWGDASQLVVWLEPGLPDEVSGRATQIAEVLRHLPGVQAAQVVPSMEAWERLRHGLGGRASILDGVEPSFLPTSVEVHLTPEALATLQTHPAFDKLKKSSGVEEVEVRGDWALRLAQLEKLLIELGLGVGLLVALACLYIIGSTIKLAALSRREEIAILSLVGATRGFIRGPLLIEGVLQGAAGAGLAAGLLFALFSLTQGRVERLLGDLLIASPLRFFDGRQLGLLVLCGGLLGFVGSSLAIDRHLREQPRP